MLVLSRKVGEELVIGGPEGIRVMVCEIHGGRVRLGVSAPSSVTVHRRELEERLAARDLEEDVP